MIFKQSAGKGYGSRMCAAGCVQQGCRGKVLGGGERGALEVGISTFSRHSRTPLRSAIPSCLEPVSSLLLPSCFSLTVAPPDLPSH